MIKTLLEWMPNNAAFIISGGVTVVCFRIALSKTADPNAKKWATGTITFILGYWLHQK